MIHNSKGSIFYGMHFYSGLAEYREPNGDSYRVYLNEDTIRSMDPTFAGKPIFVDHVDGVDPDIDQLRKEADGWVIESFFNTADGKHWVKMIIVSDRGEGAIRNGMRLSNAYLPTSFKSGGIWNGINYDKEITAGQYEHLAIVKLPRYDESVIMTPEEFKAYNESKLQELKKISNSKDEENKMPFNFFKRSKVENTVDPELCVVLPKSKVEKTLTQLINEADEAKMKDKEEEKKKEAGEMPMANMDHMVKLHDGSMCNVAELVEKHKAMALKDSSESELEMKKEPVEVEGDKKNDDVDKKLEEEKKKNALESKKSSDKTKADAVRNAKDEWTKQEAARLNAQAVEQTILLASDKVALGNKMWGSQKYNKK